MEYKNSAHFEDEVNEAIYNTYHKGFKKCKRKVAQVFHLPDLSNIEVDEPEEVEEREASGDRGEVAEVDETPGSEVDVMPLMELQSDIATGAASDLHRF